MDLATSLVMLTLQLGTMYLLASYSALISDLAGVINIGVEGMMLAGALAGVLAGAATGSWALGLLAAVAVGALMSALLALVHLHFGANVILSGFAINLLAAGGTVVVLFALLGEKGASAGLIVPPIPRLPLAFLSHVPVIGALSHQSLLLLVALGATVAFWQGYLRGIFGLRVRASGVNPDAVREAGLSPIRIKWQALLISGGLAGLAGAQLSMFITTVFVRNMVQGRGFIALGVVYLGRRRPVPTALAAIGIGVLESMANVLQVRTAVTTELIQILPYAATVVALTVYAMRQRSQRFGASL